MTKAPKERRSIRARWRGWRRSRPFWAGLFTLLSGAILTLIPMSGMRVAFVQGSVLWASLLVGLLMLLCGFTLFAGGQYHFFVGGLVIVFSLVAIVTSNIGGFLFGSLFGLIGGSLALSWIPGHSVVSPPQGRDGGLKSDERVDVIGTAQSIDVAPVQMSPSTPLAVKSARWPNVGPAVDAITVEEAIPSLWERIVSELPPRRGPEYQLDF